MTIVYNGFTLAASSWHAKVAFDPSEMANTYQMQKTPTAPTSLQIILPNPNALRYPNSALFMVLFPLPFIFPSVSLL